MKTILAILILFILTSEIYSQALQRYKGKDAVGKPLAEYIDRDHPLFIADTSATDNDSTIITKLNSIEALLSQRWSATVDSFGNTKDTLIRNMNHEYWDTYISASNTNLTADSMAVELYSITKKAYASLSFTIEDCSAPGIPLTSNSVIVIPASTQKMFRVILPKRVGLVLIRTLSSKARANKLQVAISGVN